MLRIKHNYNKYTMLCFRLVYVFTLPPLPSQFFWDSQANVSEHFTFFQTGICFILIYLPLSTQEFLLRLTIYFLEKHQEIKNIEMKT